MICIQYKAYFEEAGSKSDVDLDIALHWTVKLHWDIVIVIVHQTVLRITHLIYSC